MRTPFQTGSQIADITMPVNEEIDENQLEEFIEKGGLGRQGGSQRSRLFIHHKKWKCLATVLRIAFQTGSQISDITMPTYE